MINYTATYTDLYQLTMAQAYYLKGRQNENAVFDYFFRRLPFNGGYAIFAGLETLLEPVKIRDVLTSGGCKIIPSRYIV